MDLQANPDLISLLRLAARSERALVNVALPATVLSFDQPTQTVSVRLVPCFRRRNPANNDAVECYDPPDVHNVPILYPGGNDYSDTWPLAKGAGGLLLICDRSTDEWKAEGGTRTEPQDARRHDITDGVFLPGLRSPATPLEGDTLDAAGRVLTAPTKLVLTAPDVRLGSNSANQAVALAALVASQLSALLTALGTAAAAAALAATPGDGGAAAFAAFGTSLANTLLGWPANMGATKVVAE